MQKRILLLLFLLSSISVIAGDNSSNGTLKLKTVVIDAGHGGHDPGALGKHIQEKAITLAVALKLGELIKKNLPEVKVIYTRSTDVFIELNKRAEIANRNDADLFISIHVNSNPNPNASGVDTWVMGQYKTNENFQVAKEENKVILAENNYNSQYEGFDPNSTESYIIFNLMQNAFIGQSLEFAAGVQHQINISGRKDRGVESAPFLVLWKTTMPSVLVETGFISNENDESLLITDDGQNQMAQSIFAAFKDYKSKVDSRTSLSVFNQPNEQVTNKEQPKKTEKSISKETASNTTVKDQNKETAKASTLETNTNDNVQTKTESKTFKPEYQKPIQPTITKSDTVFEKGKQTTLNNEKENPKVTSSTNKEISATQKANDDNVSDKKEQKAETNLSNKTLTASTAPIKSSEKQTIKEPQKTNVQPSKNENTVNKQPDNNNVIPEIKPITKPIAKEIIKHIEQPKPEPIVIENPKPQEKAIPKEFPKPVSNQINKPEIKPTVTIIKDTPKVQPKPANEKQVTNSSLSKNTIKTDTTTINFAVQILSSVKKIRLDSSIFKGISKVREIKITGAYKYLVGNELEYNNIVLLKNKSREFFPDAFVVAFRNGVKIPITEALEAKNKNIK